MMQGKQRKKETLQEEQVEQGGKERKESEEQKEERHLPAGDEMPALATANSPPRPPAADGSAPFRALPDRAACWPLAELWARLTAHLSEEEQAELDRRLVDELGRGRPCVARPDWVFRPAGSFCAKCVLCGHLPASDQHNWPLFLHFLAPDQLERQSDDLELEQLLRAKRVLLRRLLRRPWLPLVGSCPHSVCPLLVRHRNSLRRVTRTLLRQQHEAARKRRKRQQQQQQRWVPRWRCTVEEEEIRSVNTDPSNHLLCSFSLHPSSLFLSFPLSLPRPQSLLITDHWITCNYQHR